MYMDWDKPPTLENPNFHDNETGQKFDLKFEKELSTMPHYKNYLAYIFIIIYCEIWAIICAFLQVSCIPWFCCEVPYKRTPSSTYCIWDAEGILK